MNTLIPSLTQEVSVSSDPAEGSLEPQLFVRAPSKRIKFVRCAPDSQPQSAVARGSCASLG